MVDMDPRIQERRIEIIRAKGKRRLRILLMLILVVLIAIASFFISKSSLLDVDEIVVSGAKGDLKELIILQANIPNSKPLLEIATIAISDRIQQIPNIKDARVAEKFTNPIFIKLSPDEEVDTISEITKAIKAFDFDGVITSNTSVDKTNLKLSSNTNLSGGLSGKPLLKKSNELLALVHSNAPELIKIGVGGVHNKESFDMKIDNGASLVQIYTSFIYHGPKIINELLS